MKTSIIKSNRYHFIFEPEKGDKFLIVMPEGIAVNPPTIMKVEGVRYFRGLTEWGVDGETIDVITNYSFSW
jgi:hypothetical protein